MYEKSPDLTATKQPEHLSMAIEIANALTERLNPQQQNEALKLIYQTIKERRQVMIDEAEKHYLWLRDTFTAMNLSSV